MSTGSAAQVPGAQRLFFALWPDDATRQALVHWQTHNLASDLRWQHRADLHMTLHFLGQVDAARRDALHDLGASVRESPFTLVIDEIGYWSGPQVLWAGPTSLPGELVALHRQLGDGLASLGFVLDERDYRPHITLARKVSREPRTLPLQPFTWMVNGFVLVASRPGTVPAYRPLAHWRLG